jgi:aspartate kinase
MKTVVHKYGGTSVKDIECIRLVARRIACSAKAGDRIAVVVSAAAGETDRLIALAREVAPEPHPRDLDLLMATGEQASVALLSLALKELGLDTESFLGFQAGIFTDPNHGRARIEKIEPMRVRAALEAGKIAVVAGFQGAASDGSITTIGRGGSDTTAVALAAALNADHCEIFTDVEGVHTADPRICSNARCLSRITYEEMMELADCGARVLHARCVEMAARYRIPLIVRSSFTEGLGTWVVPEEEIMEGTVVSGITCTTGEAKVAIRRVPDKVGVTAQIFAPIAKAGIDVDLIIQNVSADGFTDLTFTVPKDDLRRAMALAEASAREVHAGKVEAAGDIAKVSVVGLGMRSHAGVAHRMFDALAKEGIAIQMIGTSEIKVSIVIDIKYAELAVRVLHEAFGLSESA